MSGQKLRLTRFPLLLIFSLPPQSQTQFHHHRQRSRPTTSSTKSNVTLTSKLRRDCSRCRRPSLSSKRPLRACQSAPARLQSSSLNEYHQLCQTLDEVFCRLPPSRVRPAELGGDFDFLSANGRKRLRHPSLSSLETTQTHFRDTKPDPPCPSTTGTHLSAHQLLSVRRYEKDFRTNKPVRLPTYPSISILVSKVHRSSIPETTRSTE
ncbi:hypothetical protein VTJ04DRAFT_5672 [Mycothermus thermophilus]|uniref:uncharacterized protein n=1 Tax=Humicola insolens TaxID=85995 RepID=UPI003743C19D